MFVWSLFCEISSYCISILMQFGAKSRIWSHHSRRAVMRIESLQNNCTLGADLRRLQEEDVTCNNDEAAEVDDTAVIVRASILCFAQSSCMRDVITWMICSLHMLQGGQRRRGWRRDENILDHYLRIFINQVPCQTNAIWLSLFDMSIGTTISPKNL